MTEYVDVDAARQMDGLRLVLTQGVPGPWGEAAKGIFHVKGVPYTPVAQEGGGANEALRAWTGSANAPQAIYDGEPARTGWSEILFLAERIAPDPPLVPSDARERAAVFGFLHEIAGEMGFAWARRLQLLHPLLSRPEGELPAALLEPMGRLAERYGYVPEAVAAADERVRQLLALFSEQLLAQRAKGSPFFVGEQLSAADIYWATFAAMVEPLPADVNPMPAMLRAQYTITDAATRAAAHPALLEHRDFVYEKYLELPLAF